MGLYIFIAVEWIVCAIIAVLIVRAVRRSDATAELHVRALEVEMHAKVEAARAAADRAKSELEAFLARRAALVVELDLSDDNATPDFFVASEQAKPLVSSLSAQEQALGGAGFTLTAARVEPGAVRLTLSPVDRVGSAERVRRVADEWNARGGPLPPGVTAARADVTAA